MPFVSENKEIRGKRETKRSMKKKKIQLHVVCNGRQELRNEFLRERKKKEILLKNCYRNRGPAHDRKSSAK